MKSAELVDEMPDDVLVAAAGPSSGRLPVTPITCVEVELEDVELVLAAAAAAPSSGGPPGAPTRGSEVVEASDVVSDIEVEVVAAIDEVDVVDASTVPFPSSGGLPTEPMNSDEDAAVAAAGVT
jgi:hypothetical protein